MPRRVKTLLTALFATALAVPGVLLAGGTAIAGSGSVPFTDPGALGYIGLCDLAGHNVTSGSVDSVPFVWKAVSSIEPPKAYRGNGENTVLQIYQPRPDTQPAYYSGDQLTGATLYKSVGPPAAMATYKDLSLRTIIKEFPPKVDGLYELRMSFGKVDYATYTQTYPATVIQVVGNRWHVVRGGLVDCNKAKAASMETIVNHIPLTPKHPVRGLDLTPTSAPAADRASGADVGSSSPSPDSKGSKGSSNGPTKLVDRPISAPLGAASGNTSGGDGLSPVTIVVVILAALVVGGAAVMGALRFRGRRA